MLKGLIFDFDGLMIDTEYTWYPIYKDYFIKHHDYEIEMDDFLTCIGSDDTYFMNLLQDAIGHTFDLKHFDTYRKDIFLEQSRNLPMMRGVFELIQDAHAQGLKLAIATSSKHPHALNHLKRWGIDHLFNVIITADDVAAVKPAPDLFLKALNELKLNADQVYIFEDSYHGLIAANKAGIECIVVPNRVTIYSPFETQRLKLEHLGQTSIEALKDLKNENK